jgi:L-seryl-tRNA(Ser) seleniumtransferase
LKAAAVVRAMLEGEPSIAIRSEAETLVVGVWMMQPGEDKIVARRLRQELDRRTSSL